MAKAPKTQAVTKVVNTITFDNRVAKLERHIKLFPSDEIAVQSLAALKKAGPAEASRRVGYKKKKAKEVTPRLIAQLASQVKAMENQLKFKQKSKERVYILGDKMYTESQLKAEGYRIK